MPLFEYVALDTRGRQVKGSIDAENVRVARQRLRSQKIFPSSIREGSTQARAESRDIRKYFQSDSVSLKDLAVCTRQLATLVGAGLPLTNALYALSDQTDNSTLKRILVDVKESIEQGSTFAKGLTSYPKAFPRLYINMVASGEASGTLDAVLENLADYLEGQVELRRKITSALTYPILMLFLCTAVVIGLLVFVIPRIVEIFTKQGAILPLPTRIVIATSDIVINYWMVILIFLIAIILGTRSYYSQPSGRLNLDKLILRLPLFGSTFVKIATARIARTLSTLLSSGVGLLEALEITKNITANVHMRQAIDDARTGVQEGRSLAKELSRSGIFPPLLGHMIAVGEKSGELESMLGKASKAYESEVNATLGRLTSMLEPLMMIIVGGIVLLIVVSVMLPMADLIDIIQK